MSSALTKLSQNVGLTKCKTELLSIVTEKNFSDDAINPKWKSTKKNNIRFSASIPNDNKSNALVIWVGINTILYRILGDDIDELFDLKLH